MAKNAFRPRMSANEVSALNERTLFRKHVYAKLDVIITYKNPETRLESLLLVFQRLQDVGLKVNLNKCKFLKSKSSFLGHMVDGWGIHTVISKVLAAKWFSQR